ncbi:MAG TPA: hypothetical protein VFD32_01755 [Dehalococcoidia bacterium]|nr:hypothetical protein [Dehalococcoidia bacterium]
MPEARHGLVEASRGALGLALNRCQRCFGQGDAPRQTTPVLACSQHRSTPSQQGPRRINVPSPRIQHDEVGADAQLAEDALPGTHQSQRLL